MGTNGDGRIWCWANIYPKLPVRRHIAARPRGEVLATIVRMGDPLSGDGDGKRLKICLGGGLFTTLVSKGFLE